MFSWAPKLEQLTYLLLRKMFLNVVFIKVRLSKRLRSIPATIVFTFFIVYIKIVCLFVNILYINA